MVQDWLSDLAIISIEREVSKSLDYSYIRDEFARLTANKNNWMKTIKIRKELREFIFLL